MKYEYIEKFKKLGFGLFIHFGLYSVAGKGEWHYTTKEKTPEEYNALSEKFFVRKDWAKKLVRTAKAAGCKYITLTTRHHEGFSLYDTCGLNDFDAPHSACGRDLIREFVDECNKAGIIPFFYHTLLDWYHPDYETNFPSYIDYLVKSVEILCKNYGKIGGFWFDGMWNKKGADWQEDRLYGTIRKYQPEAMIINNTGLSALGATGHPEIDSVTFERGKPASVVQSEKPIAGEVCEGITDHWGYCADDVCFKSVPALLELLVDCRKCGHNLLLNAGLKGDGTFTAMEREILLSIGKVLKAQKNKLLSLQPCDIKAQNADIFTDGKYHYAVIKGVPMASNTNVARMQASKHVILDTTKRITNAVWLDNNRPVAMLEDGTFVARAYDYGTSYSLRIAKFRLR